MDEEFEHPSSWTVPPIQEEAKASRERVAIDAGASAAEVLEAREQMVRRALTVERAMIRHDAAGRSIPMQAEGLRLFGPVGRASGSRYRSCLEVGERVLGVRAWVSGEGSLAGIRLIVLRGHHPIRIARAEHWLKPAEQVVGPVESLQLPSFVGSVRR